MNNKALVLKTGLIIKMDMERDLINYALQDDEDEEADADSKEKEEEEEEEEEEESETM